MRPFARWKSPGLLAGAIVTILALVIWLGRTSEPDFRKRIAEAEKSRQWNEAKTLWDRFAGRFPAAITPADQVRRARCELLLDHPTRASELLDSWQRSDRQEIEGWQLSIELRRALGDADGINALMIAMLQNAEARRSLALLSAVTFGILTAMNAEDAQKRLRTWAEAEPDSPLAPTWSLARRLEEFDLSGPIGAGTLQEARALAERWPDDAGVRRVFVESLFLEGEYDEASRALANWPSTAKETTAWFRLEGRRLLEVEKDPRAAIPLLKAAVERIPHDWRTHYRLARALAGAGLQEESKLQARRTVEIRELLDPTTLERTLKSAFPKGQPPSPTRLIELLRRIGQEELAQAWLEWYDAERLISTVR